MWAWVRVTILALDSMAVAAGFALMVLDMSPAAHDLKVVLEWEEVVPSPPDFAMDVQGLTWWGPLKILPVPVRYQCLVVASLLQDAYWMAFVFRLPSSRRNLVVVCA